MEEPRHPATPGAARVRYMFTNYTPSLARVVGFGGVPWGESVPREILRVQGRRGRDGKGECIAKLLCVPSILQS